MELVGNSCLRTMILGDNDNTLANAWIVFSQELLVNGKELTARIPRITHSETSEYQDNDTIEHE